MTDTMTDFRMAKGDMFFLIGTSLMALCGLALFFVFIAWLVGGTHFMEEAFGTATIVTLSIGIVAGAIFNYFAREYRS